MSTDTKTVDAIVLAGSVGSLAVQQGGQYIPKPFLRLGGSTLVASVCQALLLAPSVGRLYVVGEPAGLTAALAELAHAWPGRLVVVPEGEGVLENAARAFFLHLVPGRGFAPPELEKNEFSAVATWRQQHPQAQSLAALIVTADLPFLTAADVEEFLAGASEDSALAMGLVDYRGLEWLAGRMGGGLSLESWKLGAVHLRGVSVRMSNLFLARPLLGSPRIYPLLDDLYRNRRLLDTGGGVNVKNWLSIGRAIVRHAWRVNPWWRFTRGALNLLPALAAGALARASYRLAPWLAWPWRQFLGQKDVEFIGSLLMGAQGELVLVDNPAPAIDIDVQESFLFLAAEGEAGYRRIKELLEEWRGLRKQPENSHP